MDGDHGEPVHLRRQDADGDASATGAAEPPEPPSGHSGGDHPAVGQIPETLAMLELTTGRPARAVRRDVERLVPMRCGQ